MDNDRVISYEPQVIFLPQMGQHFVKAFVKLQVNSLSPHSYVVYKENEHSSSFHLGNNTPEWGRENGLSPSPRSTVPYRERMRVVSKYYTSAYFFCKCAATPQKKLSVQLKVVAVRGMHVARGITTSTMHWVVEDDWVHCTVWIWNYSTEVPTFWVFFALNFHFFLEYWHVFSIGFFMLFLIKH